MHILAMLVAVLTAIGVILWRLRSAADATRELVDAANDAQSFFRRRSWQKKMLKSNIEAVQDSREAAVAMMVALAQSDGAMTERERDAIVFAIVKHLGATRAQAEEFLAYGRWLVKDINDVGTCFMKLTPMIQRTCSTGQINQLLTMLTSVTEADGPAGAIELDAIANLKRALK